MALPLVLPIVPPPMVNVPVQSAEALLMFNVPAFRVVPPENVVAPLNVSVPAPFLVRLKPPPIAPLSVSVPESDATVEAEPSVIAPAQVLVPLTLSSAPIPPNPLPFSVSDLE